MRKADQKEAAEHTRGALMSDAWPADAPPPPTCTAEACDPSGNWGEDARGVVVRLCPEAGKGRGAFASRPISRGAMVGVYWGELLSAREYEVRHHEHPSWRGEASSGLSAPLSDAEAAAQEERLARIAALEEWHAPMGGASNGGSYVWSLLPGGEAALQSGDMLCYVSLGARQRGLTVVVAPQPHIGLHRGARLRSSATAGRTSQSHWQSLVPS